jgi:L-rhamnose mutarotase
MESDDFTIVEKKHLDGLKRMKEANDYAKQVLTAHPEVVDVYVAPGSANYIIGCLSGTARFFLWFGGIKGDKKLGMAEVDKTAQNGRYLKGFAQILLALSSRREKQNARAEALLKSLTEQYPASPLFAAEYAKVQGRPVPAVMNP